MTRQCAEDRFYPQEDRWCAGRASLPPGSHGYGNLRCEQDRSGDHEGGPGKGGLSGKGDAFSEIMPDADNAMNPKRGQSLAGIVVSGNMSEKSVVVVIEETWF